MLTVDMTQLRLKNTKYIFHYSVFHHGCIFQSVFYGAIKRDYKKETGKFTTKDQRRKNIILLKIHMN
jgi:hypothetical protein